MVSPLVEQATSDQLIGPNWALNLEICDILNRDIGQAKDVVRGLKKRIGHKNPKVQLLALTLLETVIKNCGDVVHMHVAEKDILHEMVKIVKKKHPDFHVKEKILILIDTWQEAFGGARARYPQYYAAYQELLRAGAVFPQRSERTAPIFTPPQTHPLTSYPQNVHNPEPQQDATESSLASDLPTLSLSEIHNARGIMDVLSEMLNALDPENKEGLKQEVIVDLVAQCRSSKQRVVHLVNTTADEELLRQGLTLNDDLERVLAKHDAMSLGTAGQRDKGKSLETLVDIGDTNNRQSDQRPSSTRENQSPLNQLLLPGPNVPPSSNGTSTSLAKADPHMDLLSGDISPPSTAGDALALVTVSQPTGNAASAVMDLIVLGDVLPQSDSNNAPNVSGSPATNSSIAASAPPLQQQFTLPVSYPNGSIPNNLGQTSVYASNPMWNGSVIQSSNPEVQQASYGTPGSVEGALPPPPWEIQPSEINDQTHTAAELNGGAPPDESNYNSQPMQNFQQTGMGMNPQSTIPDFQQPGGYQMGKVPMYPQQMQSGDVVGRMYLPQMQNGQPMGIYQQPLGLVEMIPQTYQGGQFGGYGYGQLPNAQPPEQQMYGLSMQDSYSGYNSTSYQTSYTPPKKPSKPEDKLFGDLVSFSKSKPNKPDNGNTGGL